MAAEEDGALRQVLRRADLPPLPGRVRSLTGVGGSVLPRVLGGPGEHLDDDLRGAEPPAREGRDLQHGHRRAAQAERLSPSSEGLIGRGESRHNSIRHAVSTNSPPELERIARGPGGPARRDAVAPLEPDLDQIDQADEDSLNRIRWHALKGHGVPYPVRLGSGYFFVPSFASGSSSVNTSSPSSRPDSTLSKVKTVLPDMGFSVVTRMG